MSELREQDVEEMLLFNVETQEDKEGAGERRENMKNPMMGWAICATLCLVFPPIAVTAVPPDQVIELVANQLAAAQNSAGAWLGEEGFTGSIVAGLLVPYKYR